MDFHCFAAIARGVRLVAAAATLALGAAHAAPFAFITNTTTGVDPGFIRVIDVANPGATPLDIPMGAAPEAVAAERSGRYVWIADRAGTVFAIQVATMTIAGSVGIGGGTLPRGIAVDPAGAFVYVTKYFDDSVSVIDTSTSPFTVVKVIAVGAAPLGVAVDPTNTWVYVTNEVDGTVSVISTATKDVVDTITVEAGPVGVAFNPAGTRAYVANNLSDTITVIDPLAAHSILETFAADEGPFGLAITPDGNELWVTNCCADTVSVINVQGDANDIVHTFDMGLFSSPEGISIDPLGRFAYVVKVEANEVAIIDVASRTEIGPLVPMFTLNSTFGNFISASPPAPPTAVAATPGNTQATVTFIPPTLNGGRPVTGYTVTSNPPGGVDGDAGSTSTSHLVTGLTNGTAYTFTVTATNSIGTGTASAASNSVTPATVPGAPTGATAAPGNALATVTFTAPLSDGGSAITGYTVISNPAGGVDSNAGTTGTSHVVTGLTNGVAYTFTVTAANAVGTGAPSAPSNSVTPVGPPGAPTGATATAGNSQAMVTFTAPASNGGSAITGYTVISNPAGGTDTNAGTTGTSHLVTGLTNGVAYTFTVTATNAVGTSPASAPSNSVTPATVPATVPGAPTAVTATAGNTQATVTFTAPTSNGGSAITGYTVTSTPPGGVDSNAGTTGTSHVVTGLTNGVAYTFTVAAANVVGTGAPSAPSNSVTPIGPPGAPTGATATAGNAQATVTFTAPASNGGSAITGYTVTSNPPGGVDTNAGTTGTSHVVTGLTNGTAYTFTVTAANALGTSAPSAPSNSVTPLGPPAAPTGVTATARNAQATVTFTAPASNGGSAITGYTVTSNPAGGVDSNAGTTGTSHVVTGLINGTAYTFTVTATNAAGTSAPSTPSNSVTPSNNVFSGPTATGSGTATVSFTGGGASCAFAPQGNGLLQSAFFIAVSGHPKSPPAGSAPPGVAFVHGLLDFVLVGCTPGSTVSFTVTYPSALDPGTLYFKYGPTPGNPAPQWYVLPATITGNTAVFSITDGALGDDDLTANGTVVDQGGPSGPPSEPRQVPTLSEWALLSMAMLLMFTGIVASRRRIGKR